MMAEDGAQNYAYAKRKAARQLGATDDSCLPSNSEIEHELKLYLEIFRADQQPEYLLQLRGEALAIMRRLEHFKPHLAGAVLDGTAGRYAETEIHLFADSLKDVELFLLNHNIPYQMQEKPWRFGHERRQLPVFALEGTHGTIRLYIFATDDVRHAARNTSSGSMPARAGINTVITLIEPSTTPI